VLYEVAVQNVLFYLFPVCDLHLKKLLDDEPESLLDGSEDGSFEI